jgi:Xaa-Pro dipeptidase
MMRTIIIGVPDPEHLRMHEIATEALLGCEQTLRPGIAVGEVFDTHARIADDNGLQRHRLNACGYSLGTTFTPTWMDWPMLYHGNPLVAEANMVFFMHMIFVNSESEHAMTLGHTVRVTADGCERLSRSPLDLIVIS